MPYDDERQGWYPGKHIKGLLGKIKEHGDKFKKGGEYGLKTGAQQAQMSFDAAQQAANEGGVGQGDPALEARSKATGTGEARRMSRGGLGEGQLDPSDNESVLQMQRLLNQGGYTDKYGNALKEDGMMGELTTGALRKMQADRSPETAYEARGSMGITGDISDEESARAHLRGAAPVRQPDQPSRLDLMKQQAQDAFTGMKAQQAGEGDSGWLQKLQDWGMVKPAGPGGRMNAYTPETGPTTTSYDRRPRGGGRNY